LENISDQFFKKIIIISVSLTSLLAIYFARSEGALIGLAAGLLILGYSRTKADDKHLILLAMIVGEFFYFAPTDNFVLTKLTCMICPDKSAGSNGKKPGRC